MEVMTCGITEIRLGHGPEVTGESDRVATSTPPGDCRVGRWRSEMPLVVGPGGCALGAVGYTLVKEVR